MKTNFRWNAMQVSLATIFFWAWFIGMMFRYNWVYYLLVTVLLVGCVGFYVRQYLRDKKQSEQFLENAKFEHDSKVRMWRRFLWVALGLHFLTIVFKCIWIIDVGSDIWAFLDLPFLFVILFDFFLHIRIWKLKDRVLMEEE